MELLPIFYAGAFFLLALFGYQYCWLYPRLREFSKPTFVAVLAFGASSYVGFFIFMLGIASSPLKELIEGRLQTIIYALAYLIPGLGGGWLSLRLLKFTRAAR